MFFVVVDNIVAVAVVVLVVFVVLIWKPNLIIVNYFVNDLYRGNLDMLEVLEFRVNKLVKLCL